MSKEKDKPRRIRRTPSWEEKIKAKAFQLLEEDAAHDPALRDAVIAKFTGVDPAKVDRQASFRQEIQTLLIKKGLEEINNNEKLRRTLVRAELFKIMDMKDPELEPKPAQPDPLEVMIAKMKKHQELKDLVAPKTSLLEDLVRSFTSPEVMKEVFKFAAGLVNKGEGFQTTEISQAILPAQDQKETQSRSELSLLPANDKACELTP